MIPKPKNYCRCGCGQEVAATRKWVSGHNLKRRPKDAIVKNGRVFKEIKCTECGQKYEKRADSIGLVNLCGKKCMSAYQSRTRKGRELPNAKKGEYKTCIQCRKSFYVNRRRLNKNPKFCSRECYAERQRALGLVPDNFISSVDNSGKKNGRYKHGKRTGSNVTKPKVRKQVIKRDGGNWCLFCGKPGPGLHLHRIVYGSQGGKYELDNCVQLCAEHHELVHSNKKKYMPILQDHIKNGTIEKGAVDL